MSGKLLVPLDLSDMNPPELAFALRLARALSAEITLLHVIDYVPTVLPMELPIGYPLPQLAPVRDAVEKKLARIAAKTGGAKVRTLVEVGAAAAVIVEVARRRKATQIVMGSHRRGAVSRIVLGSVADRVAHTAPCPVTIVRRSTR